MHQQYREEHVLLEAEGYHIPAALTLPEGQDVRWRIVLVPGSMGNDIDGNYPQMQMKPHMYADLARQLAEQGHAVFRVILLEKLFHEKSFHLMCIFRASSIRADQARRWHSPVEKLERTRETSLW